MRSHDYKDFIENIITVFVRARTVLVRDQHSFSTRAKCVSKTLKELFTGKRALCVRNWIYIGCVGCCCYCCDCYLPNPELVYVAGAAPDLAVVVVVVVAAPPAEYQSLVAATGAANVTKKRKQENP